MTKPPAVILAGWESYPTDECGRRTVGNFYPAGPLQCDTFGRVILVADIPTLERILKALRMLQDAESALDISLENKP
jgi:hypothetical protein